YLGAQQNLYTGERYELTEAHVQEWERLWRQSITPSRYLLMVETGDEVLDYREAVARYAGAEQIVVQGGDHMFQSFPEHIPRLLEFAGFPG
ncbi:MAG: esterase, partial [Gammaproteobacteria bacterium]|nr:esterase [Gammaproteobacteria bacterium]